MVKFRFLPDSNDLVYDSEITEQEYEEEELEEFSFSSSSSSDNNNTYVDKNILLARKSLSELTKRK
jgi:hypothetical protein